jgi:amidase
MGNLADNDCGRVAGRSAATQEQTVHQLTITELAPLIRARSVSPIAVTQSLLERIDALDGRLKAYATVTAELALQQAAQAQDEIARGVYRGPLHGVPVAVKDLCDTAGIRTMGGCGVYADRVPLHDATVVTRLREAGAVLLGKLNLTEGAMAGYHPDFAVPENPWKPSHWSGVSSSGCGAATAAGLAFATIGTDTGGSIRHPSAACGVVGLKPTWGRVSRHGVLPLAQSLDHVGPMTRCSQDAGLVLAAIAGRDPLDATSLGDPVPDMAGCLAQGVRGLRIGWDAQYASVDLAPDHAAAVAQVVQVLGALGAEIVPVQMPARLRDYLPAWALLCQVEAADAHRDTFPAQADAYGPFFRQWLEQGRARDAIDYAHAHHLRLQCAGELRAMMRGIDVLVCPSTPREAFAVTPAFSYGPIPPGRDPWHARFTAPFNFSGLPTLSVPCGLSDTALPLSVQFVGHALREDLLVGVGHAYEQASEHRHRHPPGW